MERKGGYLLIFPLTSIITGLAIYPLFRLIELSLCDVTLIAGQVYLKFVGINNYIRVFQDPLFHYSCFITLVFSGVSVFVEIILGTFLAIAIGNISNERLRSLAQLILLTTMMIPPVAVALLWRFILYPNLGLFDKVTTLLNLPRINWLGDPFWALMSIIIVDVWHWTAFVFLIVYAGYTSLPSTIFEAAALDGAKSFTLLRYIILPLLTPTLSIAFLFRTTDILRAFGEIQQLTFGGPREATTILNLLIYRMTFQYIDWGYASVVSIILIVISSFLLIITLKVTSRGR
ncbi:MAG: sugar ABC transporter permease [Nitrososphaeria archaeon]